VTTRAFLDLAGLRDLTDLPQLEDVNAEDLRRELVDTAKHSSDAVWPSILRGFVTHCFGRRRSPIRHQLRTKSRSTSPA